jgi:hypothetical protein
MPTNPFEPPQEVNEPPRWSPATAYLRAAVWAVAVLALWVVAYLAVFIWTVDQATMNR